MIFAPDTEKMTHRIDKKQLIRMRKKSWASTLYGEIWNFAVAFYKFLNIRIYSYHIANTPGSH